MYVTELLLSYLDRYGCLAIFIFIFLQEVGLPNPIPNEFVLIFSGFLAYKGLLNLPLLLLAAFLGDLVASLTLFSIFFFFGKIIMNRKPKWIPLPHEKLNIILNKINKQGTAGVFLGRLTPFIKGYVSVLSGLIHFNPRKYIGILISTSIIWVFVYIMIGYFTAPYCDFASQSNFAFLMSGIALLIIVLYIINFLISRKKTITD